MAERETGRAAVLAVLFVFILASSTLMKGAEGSAAAQCPAHAPDCGNVPLECGAGACSTGAGNCDWKCVSSSSCLCLAGHTCGECGCYTGTCWDGPYEPGTGCTVAAASYPCAAAPCDAGTPTNLLSTGITQYGATLDWTPTTARYDQRIYVGDDQAAVDGGCPAAGACAIKNETLDPYRGTLATGDVLAPNTTYYWRIVNYGDSGCEKSAAASFCTPGCPDAGWCARRYPPQTGPGEEAVRVTDGVSCVYSAERPRVVFYGCPNPDSCGGRCDITEDARPETFCGYCNYTLALGNNGTMELKDSSCGGAGYEVGIGLDNGSAEVVFHNLTVHDFSGGDITDLVTLKALDVDKSLPQPAGSLAASLRAQNVSPVRALAAHFETGVAGLRSDDPSAPLAYDSYDVEMRYDGSMVPADNPPGARLNYVSSLDIYKCASGDFDFAAGTCNGTWKNSAEAGAGLEKSFTQDGSAGSVNGTGYTGFSAFAIGALILSIGSPCLGDADCLSGCCGTPTVHGERYCVKCGPPSCDQGFCSCEPDFADKCRPPCTAGDPECPCSITNEKPACGGWCDPGTDPACPAPVGCLEDGDCVPGAYCMNLVIDPQADPRPEQMCLACSTKRDGYCPSRNCAGSDPDCCDVTLYSPSNPDGDCSGFGGTPPYFCENRTIDNLPLREGTCRACDDSGSRDQYVPDPVCMGRDADSCNSTLACGDTNTYCACGIGDLAEGTCSFGTCLVKRGNFCDGETEAQDCNSDTYCARQAHLCASKCFIFLSPSIASAKVGETIPLRAVLDDPVGEERTYDVRIVESGAAGSGAPFTTFLNGLHTMTVTVPKDGRREISLQFRAGAVGKYTVALAASDKEFPSAMNEGINSDQCALGWNRAEMLVETESSRLSFLSAPGPGLAELCVMVGLAGAVFVLIERRKV